MFKSRKKKIKSSYEFQIQESQDPPSPIPSPKVEGGRQRRAEKKRRKDDASAVNHNNDKQEEDDDGFYTDDDDDDEKMEKGRVAWEPWPPLPPIVGYGSTTKNAPTITTATTTTTDKKKNNNNSSSLMSSSLVVNSSAANNNKESKQQQGKMAGGLPPLPPPPTPPQPIPSPPPLALPPPQIMTTTEVVGDNDTEPNLVEEEEEEEEDTIQHSTPAWMDRMRHEVEVGAALAADNDDDDENDHQNNNNDHKDTILAVFTSSSSSSAGLPKNNTTMPPRTSSRGSSMGDIPLSVVDEEAPLMGGMISTTTSPPPLPPRPTAPSSYMSSYARRPPPPSYSSFNEDYNTASAAAATTTTTRTHGRQYHHTRTGSFKRSISDMSENNNNMNNNNDDDDGEGGPSLDGAQTMSVLETIEDIAMSAIATITEYKEEAVDDYQDTVHYDWRDHWKGGIRGRVTDFVRFLLTGFSPSTKQTDEELQDNLNGLAHLLSMLREYQERFGPCKHGGPRDQEYLLREITRDLYLGGTPLWSLEPVMKKVAEGLTGKKKIDFFLLPRRGFIFAPSSGATSMFSIVRGFDMQRLFDMEKVAVRLASYASNTQSVSNIPSRLPKPQELRHAFRTETVSGVQLSQQAMMDEILSIASETEGLFYYIHSRQYKVAARQTWMDEKLTTEMDEFWTVEDSTQELFTRLAAMDALRNIEMMDAERKVLYGYRVKNIFRFVASAAACGFWFGGSWQDMLVSGMLAVMVTMIGDAPFLSTQERIIFEAVASFSVGLIAGLIAMHWPNQMCFSAMAISGVLDILQGFRVVYAIIEIMSRHTVTGGADFLEGMFFTLLIAYSLRFGRYTAATIHGAGKEVTFAACRRSVDPMWNLLLVPLASIAWSGLFNPAYYDLPLMAAHGCLGYFVSWQLRNAPSVNNFVAAMVVTFSAGIVSRFTGRQALGNTVAGLYALIPGAYLVQEVYNNELQDFLSGIFMRSIIIGMGSWTGTILCSPTVLGTNLGLLLHKSTGGGGDFLSDSVHGSLGISGSDASYMGSTGSSRRNRDKAIRKNGTGSLLFF